MDLINIEKCPLKKINSNSDILVIKTKIKYLKALGKSLGVSSNTISPFINQLLAKSHDFNYIDCYKEFKNQPPEDLVKIEEIGAKFVNEEKFSKNLRFTVGSWVLALLREDIGSGYFENLESYIGVWTDGKGIKQFKNVINK